MPALTAYHLSTSLIRVVLSVLVMTSCEQSNAAQEQAPELAVVSYWQPRDYRKIPEGSIAMLNLNNGIVGTPYGKVDRYRPVVTEANKKGVKLLAYVPIGFGERTPGKLNSHGSVGQSIAQIRTQIDTWITTFGVNNLHGIFFDEASLSCTQAKTEYAALSQYVRSRGLKTTFWNPGWVGKDWCFVKATPPGDHIVTFEGPLTSYLSKSQIEYDLNTSETLAQQSGIKTWHLIHTAKGSSGLRKALRKLIERAPDYAYVTNYKDWKQGVNTWGSPPPYWKEQKKCLVEKYCPKK